MFNLNISFLLRSVSSTSQLDNIDCCFFFLAFLSLVVYLFSLVCIPDSLLSSRTLTDSFSAIVYFVIPRVISVKYWQVFFLFLATPMECVISGFDIGKGLSITVEYVEMHTSFRQNRMQFDMYAIRKCHVCYGPRCRRCRIILAWVQGCITSFSWSLIYALCGSGSIWTKSRQSFPFIVRLLSVALTI